MKNQLYLLCGLFLIACEKDDIKPRTNPQFSVAFIQDIDETGVEFAANIYDYGSVEILEYGFVYDRTTNPSVEHSELVKMEGRPEVFFTLKAIHSMVKGQKYNVAAYIKTTESTVYSALFPFISEGSTGFIYEKIEMHEPLYFGDTITVWGKNLSRDPSVYQFSIQGARSEILEVNRENFKVRLPGLFDVPSDPNLPLNVEILVVDKAFYINQKADFKNPTFILEPTSFDYIDTLTIRGEFLDSKEVSIRYINGNTSHNIVPISVTGEKVVFIPKAPFTSLEPEFSLTVRGKSYSFNNFKINPTEIKVKHVFSQSLYTTFSVEVTNPNPYYPLMHRLYIPGIDNSYIEPKKIDNSFISFQINPFSNIKYPRSFKLNLITLENLSKQEIEFTVTDAALKHMEASLSTFLSRGISHGDKGYLFLHSEVRAVDPVLKTIERVVTVPDSYYSAALFLVKHPTGKMYMGGFTQDGERVLRSFDPASNSVEFLGTIPSKISNASAVYITGRYLYYEGFYGDMNSPVEERYRYDLVTKEWQKLNEINQIGGDPFNWKSFLFEDDLYSFRRELSTGNLRLQRFDPTSERWQVLSMYPHTGNIFEVFVLGDKVFYNDGSGKYRVNMRSLGREKISNIYSVFENHFSFQIENKFYHYASPFFYEYDPEYFTY